MRKVGGVGRKGKWEGGSRRKGKSQKQYVTSCLRREK